MFKTLKLCCIVLYCIVLYFIVLCAFVGESGLWTEYGDSLYLKTNFDGVVIFVVGPKLTVAWEISDDGKGMQSGVEQRRKILAYGSPTVCKSANA